MTLYLRHLRECFALGMQALRDDCPCPPVCRRLCERLHFDPDRSPRAGRRKEDDRPYTAIPNDILAGWGPSAPEELTDGMWRTYIFLVSQTRKDCRWVERPAEQLAAARSLKPATFRAHCGVLESTGLILRVRMRELSNDHNSNEHAVLVLDLPPWYRTPNDIAAEEQRQAMAAHERELDRFDRELSRPRARRRARSRPRGIDVDKIRRERAAFREAGS
jgi:hypothetical protein